MNTIRKGMLVAVFIGFTASSGHGQGATVHTQSVPFDNPGRPGIVKVISGEGNVTITGYAGREVRIKATASNKKTLPSEEDPKAKGLKRIAGSGFSVTTNREENAVVITRPMGDKTDLEIQAPVNTSLKIGGNFLPPKPPTPPNPQKNNASDIPDLQSLVTSSIGLAFGFPGGMFEGSITVEGITGEVEVSTLDGDIVLKNISGAVVANCMEGDITTVFRMVPENRPMAFSTVDGDIDITLPQRIKAIITASTVGGGVYTDFEMETMPGAVKRNEKPKQGLLNTLIGPGSTVMGKINGGGIDIQMKTIDGSIYIRKAK
ncbi:MAG: DUF4097 family beta strand repeat-containing protein [Candidatus Latescibacterota bacterium]